MHSVHANKYRNTKAGILLLKRWQWENGRMFWTLS